MRHSQVVARRLATLRAALFGGQLTGLLFSGILAVQASAPTIQLQVPFFPDKTNQCGPATLAGVLSFWGKPTEPQTLRKEMYVEKLKGTLPMDMVRAAETRGLKVKMVAGNTDQIKQELNAGRPVLAMLNMGYAMMPVGHYVVVTGYDDAKGGFYLHSGGKANRFMSYKKFEQKWKTTDYWAMLASQ